MLAAGGAHERPGTARGAAEAKVKQLISIWQEQVRQYIDRQGDGDPAVLSQTRALHSRDILRPGRITFGALDTESDLPGRNGWDMQGVLVGKQASGSHTWYVFVVGIVRRSNYRPMEVQDIRMVALRAEGRKLGWETSTADPQSVQRYRDAFAGIRPGAVPGGHRPIQHERLGRPCAGAGDAVRRRLVAASEHGLGRSNHGCLHRPRRAELTRADRSHRRAPSRGHCVRGSSGACARSAAQARPVKDGLRFARNALTPS